MRIGKVVRKVAALSAGISLVGATMFGAMAADLSEYPSPFIKDGMLDAIVVIGTGGTSVSGYAQDVIGVTDIVANLQASATTSAGTSSAAVTVTGDTWKVGTSSKTLELSEVAAQETVANITSNIDDDEFDLLAGGSIQNNKGTFDYTEKFYFDDATTGYVMLDEDDEDNVADMLRYEDGKQIAKYELDFASKFESDIEDADGTAGEDSVYLGDFEDEKITMLGMEYTIVKARRDNKDGDGVELTLMGGSSLVTLEEGQTKMVRVGDVDYEVTCIAITDQAPIVAKFQVDTEVTDTMGDGDTETLSDGTELGVTEIIPNEAGDVTLDMVTFYLGAQKIVLKDDTITDTVSSDDLEMGEDDITDAEVTITGDVSEDNYVKIDKIIIDMTADDECYVEAGETLSAQLDEPNTMFPGNWDIEYKGLSSVTTEKIAVDSSGSKKYNLVFDDADGNDVKLPLAYTDGNTKLKIGDDDDKFVYDEDIVIEDDDYFILTDYDETQDGERETYVLQYTKAQKNNSDGDMEIQFKNLGNGDIIKENYDDIDGGISYGTEICELDLGGQQYKVYANTTIISDDFSINVDLDGSGTLGDNNDVHVNTNAGAVIAFEASDKAAAATGAGNWVNVTISTEDADDYEDLEPTDLILAVKAADGEMTLSDAGSLTYQSIDDSDLDVAYTTMGAYVEYDNPTSSPETIDIEYPKSQRVPLVYFVAEGASVAIGGGAGTENVNINLIDVGATKLDSEVADVTAQNVISVGGACVNSATAALAGVAPGTCGKAGADPIGLRENKAVLNLMEHDNGNVALIVAGWRAEDTRRASNVLATHMDYALSGMIMEVSGTTMNDISVGAPVEEPEPAAEGEAEAEAEAEGEAEGEGEMV